MKRSTKVALWTVCTAIPAVGGPVDGNSRPGQSSRRNTASSAVQPHAGAPAYSTAEDVLRALRKRRPPNVVIPPGSLLSGGRKVAREPLFPEGWSLVSRTGRLVHEEDQWILVFAAQEDLPSLPLLRNSTLEGMIRESVASDTDLYFVVSGELTVYDGANYLLPRLAMRTDTRPAAVVPHGGNPTSDGVPRDSTSSSGTDGRESAEDVLAMLQAHTPPERMVKAVDAPHVDRVGNESLVSSLLLPDGTPLVDRPGRVIPSGPWFKFVLESDSPESPEPPMTLLASRNAALMVDASDRGRNGTVFLVSGEVTVFDGENYLLPRSVMRRNDSGNLRN